MFSYLDTQGFMALGFFVFVSSFFLGTLMNGILDEDGFGVGGNTFVLATGAFIGFYASDWIVPFSRDPVTLAVCAISGAFISLATLAILKAGLNKAGY